MSTSINFLKSEAGKQALFGTAVAPDFLMPFTGTYQDVGDFHEAPVDSGRWVPVTFIDRVSNFARFSFQGAAFFELLPVFLSAGFADLTPGGAGPYTYDHTLDLASPGAPSPYTFRFGGDEDIGGTGPAVQIQDSFCERVQLSGNANDRSVTLQSDWFGADVDDNSGAGYAFAGAALPAPLGMMRFPFSTLEYQDATTTGGDFLTMTAFACTLLDWTLNIRTGIAPKWAADANQLEYCGVRIDTPLVEFTATLRTDATSYANVMAKANADSPTYQELQFTQVGAGSRQAIWQMTGRWLPLRSAHDRSNNEVVMNNAVFRASGYPSQTTTPHAFGWELDTLWSHD